MPRTTAEEVRKIYPGIPLTQDLDPFISPASVLVDDHCVVSDVTDPGYMTEARLLLVETWLAAHFYHQYKPRKESVSLGGGAISEKTKSKVELGFDNSDYGQTAMRLDRTGNLAKINAEALASQAGATASRPEELGIVWLGTDRDAYGRER